MQVLGRKAIAGRAALAQSRATGRRFVVNVKATMEPSTAAETTLPAKQELRNAGPDPKRFTVADGQAMDVATAAVAAVARLGCGGFVLGYNAGLKEDDGKYAVTKVGGRKVSETSDVIPTLKRPAQPLELYEFEGCPFCKKVREAMCILDLDAIMYPCPKDGATWRPKANAMGGKKQFPFLVDPNTGKQMYESDEIIAYLFQEYGGSAEIPLGLRLGPLTTISCGLGTLARPGKGNAYRKSRLPAQPLVFWGYEMSPFVKVARETLCELELPYLYRTAARGSPKRQELLDKRGHFQVPYLEDPNEGVYLFESSAINEYLNKTYAV
ncbi:hypothetical protein HYH03_001733 [Edaphochlamys debaryana]|uniref:GST N-terminal domain-containing protein n=1 Tax=Edaphochlamys debaryana TaxID=47281 RepID=A0A835YFU3_9CHLO|nr:hypothetical protein HYH03_001733 [Edaphochlamys debaryana]|eukprot:KAG2500151.1 hypothetical protein HYH03_001733 [Edaphochlamys debaryana]